MDFSALKSLTGLITLTIAGSFNSPVTPVGDLYFLSNLTNLKELCLGISLVNKDIRPLLALSKLERLFLPDALRKKFEDEKIK